MLHIKCHACVPYQDASHPAKLTLLDQFCSVLMASSNRGNQVQVLLKHYLDYPNAKESDQEVVGQEEGACYAGRAAIRHLKILYTPGNEPLIAGNPCPMGCLSLIVSMRRCWSDVMPWSNVGLGVCR